MTMLLPSLTKLRLLPILHLCPVVVLPRLAGGSFLGSVRSLEDQLSGQLAPAEMLPVGVADGVRMISP